MSDLRSKIRTALLMSGVLTVGSSLMGCKPSSGGPSIAYAHVRGDGNLDAANSLNVVAFDGGNGLYCFKLSFTPKNAVATITNDPTADQGLAFTEVAVPPTTPFSCAKISQPDAFVSVFKETSIGGGQSAGGHAFYVYWTK
jgi:hypothetical protein